MADVYHKPRSRPNVGGARDAGEAIIGERAAIYEEPARVSGLLVDRGSLADLGRV